MNEATKGSLGSATSSAGVPIWRSRPSTITPTWSASAAASSKSWVTSSTGMSSPASSCCSSARTSVFVWASSAESGSSSEQDLRVARERARERDALALAAGEAPRAGALEMRDPEAVEVLVGRVAARVLDVLADGQMREERVVLEDEPDAAAGRGQGDVARLASNQTSPPDAMRPGGRRDEPGDRAQDGRLAGAGRPDERHRRVDVEAQLEAESPKRDGDLFEE